MGLLSLDLLYEIGLLLKQLFVRFLPSKSKNSSPYGLSVFSSLQNVTSDVAWSHLYTAWCGQCGPFAMK